MSRSWLQRIALPLTFLVVLLIAWQLLPAWFGVPRYVFPRPTEIAAAVWENPATAMNHVRTTAFESWGGFILGSVVGFLVGVVSAESRTVRRMILPYVVGSNAIPVVAVAPIVVLWFGHGLWSKVVVAAFLCFFPVTVNTYRGLTDYDPLHGELFRSLGSTRWQFFCKFKLWNGLPYLLSGLRLSATYSVIGAVVAEFVGSDRGLGFGMLQATYNLNTPRLYGYLVIACALGMLMYSLVAFVEWVLVRWGRLSPSERIKW